MLLVLANVMSMVFRPVTPPRAGARLALATRQAPVEPAASAHQNQQGIFGSAEARKAARDQHQQQPLPPKPPFSSVSTQVMLKKQTHGNAEARREARWATEAPAAKPVASPQCMIKRGMLMQLAELGYNSDEIERLDPNDAAAILSSQRAAEILAKATSATKKRTQVEVVGTTFRSQQMRPTPGVPSPGATFITRTTSQPAYDANARHDGKFAAGAARTRQQRYTAPVPPAAAATVAADGSVLGAGIYLTSRNALERREARDHFFSGYQQQQQPPPYVAPPQARQPPVRQPAPPARAPYVAPPQARQPPVRQHAPPARAPHPHEIALAAERDKLLKERVVVAEARAKAATAEARANAATAEARAFAAAAEAEARAAAAAAESRASAATAQARASAATAAAEARATAAAAEERAAAAEERAVAAEGRADQVEKSAKEAAVEAGGRASAAMPTWLQRLAGGEMDALAERQVMLAVRKAAAAARQTPKSQTDAAVKKAWLASLDVGMWGKAALALSEAASEAAEMAELDAMCGAGDAVSCRILSEHETSSSCSSRKGGVKKAWLEKLNATSWSAAAGMLSVAASDATAVSAAALEALEAFGFIKHLTKDSPEETGAAEDEDQ